MATENTNNEQNDIFKDLIIQTSDPVSFKISSNCYEKIMLPSLPTNFAMLMSNIDYPDKAKQNPNGSLFMKPTKEILQDKASDIGIQFFGGNLKWDTIQNYRTKTINDSYNEFMQMYSRNNVLNELLFGAGTNDIDNHVAGSDINQETRKRSVQNPGKSFDGSPIDAIDKYVTNSIPVVEQLVRAIVGKETTDIKNILKLISDFNTTNGTQIQKYLEKNNEVLKQLTKSAEQEQVNNLENRAKACEYVSYIRTAAADNESYKKFKDTPEGKKFTEWLTECLNDIDGKTWKLGIQLYLKYIQIAGKPLTSSNKVPDLLNKDNKSKITFGAPGAVSTTVSTSSVADSKQYKYELSLNEDEENSQTKETRENLESFNFDEVYNNVQSSIRDVMLKATMTDPEEWNIVKNAKTRMEKLKEACDKEINAKIEMICRTVQNGQSSIGEKFKAAISKHPMRAEGLKNIWARYSDDLTDRIESRIRSIGGMNGNSNIFMSIKRFLVDTYPAVIAMMITWKCVLQLCKEYYNKYPKVVINFDEKVAADAILNKATANILTFYIDDNSENQQQTQN